MFSQLNKSAIAATALCLLVSSLNAWGQSDEEYAIRSEISAVSLIGNIEGLKIQTGESIEELDIFTGTRSRLITYRGDPELVFFREVKNKEDAVIRKPVASVTINRDNSRYLLFFMPLPGNSESYNVVAFPDDLNTFPAGTLRFLNLTSHPVGVRIHDQQQIIQSRNFSDIRGDFKHGNYYQAVFISAPEGRDPFRSYSGRIFFNQRMRMVYLIFPAEGGQAGSIRLRAIREAVR